MPDCLSVQEVRSASNHSGGFWTFKCCISHSALALYVRRLWMQRSGFYCILSKCKHSAGSESLVHTLRSAPLLPDKTAGTTLIYPLRAARIVADMHTNTECRHAHTHTIVHCLPTAGSQLRQHKTFDFILSFTFLVFCDKIIPGSLSLSQSFSLCLCWNHFLKSQMEKNHFTSLLK